MLSALPNLLRLDLTGNTLASLDGLTAHTSLKWLSVASNALTSVPALDFPELQVLGITLPQDTVSDTPMWELSVHSLAATIIALFRYP